MAAVEGGKDPWLSGVEVNALNTFRACEELPLQNSGLADARRSDRTVDGQ